MTDSEFLREYVANSRMMTIKDADRIRAIADRLQAPAEPVAYCNGYEAELVWSIEANDIDITGWTPLYAKPPLASSQPEES